MVTPFTENGDVNYSQARRLASALLDSGSDGLVIGGWDTATNGQRQAAVWFPGGTSGYNQVLMIPASASNPSQAGDTWNMEFWYSIELMG